MLVVKNNQEFLSYKLGTPVTPLKESDDVVVVIDPGKTNMAVLFGSPFGEVFSILEFSGNNRGNGPVEDTTLYCNEFYTYLDAYLGDRNVYVAGIEKAIMKKGMEQYNSQMVLTEIRARLLEFFNVKYGFSRYDLEINNSAWKGAVLPDGYRGHNEKGSKRYFKDYFPDSPFNNYFRADVTDVICMYWYLIAMKCKDYKIVCKKREVPRYKCSVGLYPEHMSLDGFTPFEYNKNFDVEANISYYINRSTHGGITTVPIDCLNVADIYSYATCFSTIPENSGQVRMAVIRCP